MSPVPHLGLCPRPLSRGAHPRSHWDWAQVQGRRQQPAWRPVQPSVPAAFGHSQGLCPLLGQPWCGLGDQQGAQQAAAAGPPAPGVLAAAVAGAFPSLPAASWPCGPGRPGHQGWVAGAAPSGRGPGRTAVWGPRGSRGSAGWQGAGAAGLRLRAGGACQQRAGGASFSRWAPRDSSWRPAHSRVCRNRTGPARGAQGPLQGSMPRAWRPALPWQRLASGPRRELRTAGSRPPPGLCRAPTHPAAGPIRVYTPTRPDW